MKNILTILSDVGVQVEESLHETVLKAVAKEYKTIAEVEKKNNRIAELEKQNGELSEQIKAFEGDRETLENLKKQVADFEATEKTRKEEQEAAELEAKMRGRFEGLNGENKYINEYTEKAVFEDFKKAISDAANAGKSDKDIYSELVKDKNIYQNPNTVVVPPAGGSSKSAEDELKEARAIMGLKN